MQKGNRLKLVLIPVLVGLVVTLIAHQALSEKGPGPAAEEVQRAPVVAARQAIPARVKVTEEMVTVRQVPVEALQGSEYTEVQQVVGLISTVPMAEGEALLRSKLVEEGKGTLPFRIPEGKRAVTIRIDEVSGVAGFPDVGDRVDLILVLQPDDKSAGPATSRLLAENLPVLVRGPNPGERSLKPEDGVRISSLTLAMTPDQAVEVALAEKVGELKVALRRALAEGDRGGLVLSETRWMQSGPAAP